MSKGLQFSSAGRFAGEEDELELMSVGIDIGSTTTHLIFSIVRLERRGATYVTVERRVVRESAITLTPYTGMDHETIDKVALGAFIDGEYAEAGIERSAVDTGALILTGLAARRDNAREIGEIFADEAGRFVTVSAGDGLEATMAAHGSGAAEASETTGLTLSVDLGGGTTKFALCAEGSVQALTAIDVGARIVLFDDNRVLTHVEPAGVYFGKAAGVDVSLGRRLTDEDITALVDRMAEAVVDVASSVPERAATWEELLRLPALPPVGTVSSVFVSGGVSAFLSGKEHGEFGDLGPFLAKAVAERLPGLDAPVQYGAGIRATAMGASQYTVQVSGSTIFVDPADVLPKTNVPVIGPQLDLSGEVISSADVETAVKAALERIDATDQQTPVALALRWGGSATYRRLSDLSEGLIAGMRGVLDHGNPLIIVSEGDIGGLLGMHLQSMGVLTGGVVSVDGIDLKEFDFVDIGAMIAGSGAVPVVIKSLVFPKGELAFLTRSQQ